MNENKIIEIETLSDVVLFCVFLPNDYEHRIIDEDVMIGTYRCKEGWIAKYYVGLPKGDWQYLGTPSEIKEQNWGEWVDIGMDYTTFGYKNYNAKLDSIYKYPFETAKESGNSLLEANKVHLNEQVDGKWLVLFKIKDEK